MCKTNHGDLRQRGAEVVQVGEGEVGGVGQVAEKSVMLRKTPPTARRGRWACSSACNTRPFNSIQFNSNQ